VFDKETNLIYYNYRYLNSILGRWCSRDKMYEEGGNNLYSFIGNAPTQGFDFLGLFLYKELDLPATKSKCEKALTALNLWAVGYNQTLLDHWFNGNGAPLTTSMSTFDFDSSARIAMMHDVVMRGIKHAKKLKCTNKCYDIIYGNTTCSMKEPKTSNSIALKTHMIFGFKLWYSICAINYSLQCDKYCEPLAYCASARCKFHAKDRVNFWDNGYSDFAAPPYIIKDRLVRACAPNGKGFEITASSTETRSYCVPAN